MYYICNMKRFLLFLFLLSTYVSYAQFATESVIPFPLNTDGDAQINVIDTDDDNDGVLDNLDAFPLDNALSMPNTATDTITTIADAGVRSTAPTNNYGGAMDNITRNLSTRSLFFKYTMPAGLSLSSATVTIYTNTENDSLDVYLLANNSWTEMGINYSNAPTTPNIPV